MRFNLVPLALLAMGLTFGCGGGGSSNPPAPTGTLTLQLGSDSIPGYAQAWVSVEKIEGSLNGSSWVSLGTVQKSFDLMALQNGHGAIILPATRVLAGTYTQFRITWDNQNHNSGGRQPAYLVLPNGTELFMTMPTTKTTVVKGQVAVPANGTTTAQLMLSAQQAVQTRPGPIYTFQATGGAYDLAATAKITGHLVDGATPLANVEVLAETVDGLDVATIQRRATTDATGSFTLEALSSGTGTTYYVVAQPLSTSAAYDAKAQKVITATPATYPANFSFSGPAVPGALTLTITVPSAANQATWGELRKTLVITPSEGHNLIVQSQPVATSLVQDQVYFTLLSPNSYGVTAQRSTDGGAPVMKVGSTLAVTSNTITPANITYP